MWNCHGTEANNGNIVLVGSGVAAVTMQQQQVSHFQHFYTLHCLQGCNLHHTSDNTANTFSKDSDICKHSWVGSPMHCNCILDNHQHKIA